MGINNISACTLYDSNQEQSVEISIQPLVKNNPYTILVPIAGLRFGVASGIYRFIYNELPATDKFSKIVLNNKTFYVDDNIAIIDYFIGF